MVRNKNRAPARRTPRARRTLAEIAAATGVLTLSTREVCQVIGIDRSTLHRWQHDETKQFPLRRQLSAGRVAWVAAEIRQWIESRPAAPGGAPR